MDAASTIEFMALRDGYRLEQNMTAELNESLMTRVRPRERLRRSGPPVFTGS